MNVKRKFEIQITLKGNIENQRTLLKTKEYTRFPNVTGARKLGTCYKKPGVSNQEQ